jgi:hypothetical protein
MGKALRSSTICYFSPLRRYPDHTIYTSRKTCSFNCFSKSKSENAAAYSPYSKVRCRSLTMPRRGMPVFCLKYACKRRRLMKAIFHKAALYGKCIVADYNSVHKDKCANEFMKLKDCYLVRRISMCLMCKTLTYCYRNTPRRHGDFVDGQS